MTQHHQRPRPWRWVLVLGAMAGALLTRPALAQVTPPATLVPLQTFSITGNASGSETTDTSTADYTVKFTLAPDRILDPTTAAVLLRLETEDPQPCFDVGIPDHCFFPDGKGGYTLADNCRVSVKAFKDELTYARDLTPLLQSVSATLQQVKGEWQARIVTTFTEAVAKPAPCAITLTVGTYGVEHMPISRSDVKWGATWP